MHVVGQDDPGSDVERCAGASLPNPSRNASICVASRCEWRSKRFTVKEEASTRNPIAAIVQHDGSVLGIGIRRNALRLSALRLLIDDS